MCNIFLGFFTEVENTNFALSGILNVSVFRINNLRYADNVNI